MRCGGMWSGRKMVPRGRVANRSLPMPPDGQAWQIPLDLLGHNTYSTRDGRRGRRRRRPISRTSLVNEWARYGIDGAAFLPSGTENIKKTNRME
jgi:hypothetical protein